MVFPDSVAVIRAGEAGYRVLPFFPADPDLLAAARRAAARMPAILRGPRRVRVVIGGTGVSGPVFLDNASYREWIFRIWRARCVDMESTAYAQVCWANHKPFLIARGLSDLAGAQRAPNPIDDNQSDVSAGAARVLHAILDEIQP
jgi:adenosylhomocysteine nucleosidase